MRVPVLTAVSDAVWESDLVAAFEHAELGVTVVRRCVDLADLLATASTGQASVALLSADLRRLDRDALVRLAVAGVAVIGLVPRGDTEAEDRLRRLGVRVVLPADALPAVVSAAVADAVSTGAGTALLDAGPALRPRPGTGEPRDALPDLPPTVAPADGAPGSGRLVAVWGPTGAPGRSTVAIGIASELAELGRSVLLVDADVYGGVVAQVLGLLDEAPGLAAACRLANAGNLDLGALADLARLVAPRLRVLSGIARADRWPELRPAALEATLDLARHLADITVVDCGFGLEQDEELAYDTLAPRRNGATFSVLQQADTVLAIGTADPVGLQRLIRGLAELREAVPDVAPRVIVNRLRSGSIPGDASGEVRAALDRYAGVKDVSFVPYDRASLDAALAVGRTLAEAAPGSAARQALRDLAGSLVGVKVGRRRGRRRPDS